MPPMDDVLEGDDRRDAAARSLSRRALRHRPLARHAREIAK